jgi:hypothetical protein
VLRRVLILGIAVLSVSVRGFAQQVPSPTPDNPAKPQTYLYENALKTAVELGGQKLARQALAIVPQVTLIAAGQPIVRGVKLPNFGFFFDVQVPDIDRSTVMVWDMVNQSSRPVAGPTPPGAQPVNTVRPMAVVAPDPMEGAAFNPDRAYSNFVRESLIDALLDSSGVLPLAPGESVTIAASGIDQPGATLYTSHKLMLTIKGSDLQELRQGHITRDQAKQRIIEDRF